MCGHGQPFAVRSEAGGRNQRQWRRLRVLSDSPENAVVQATKYIYVYDKMGTFLSLHIVERARVAIISFKKK